MKLNTLLAMATVAMVSLLFGGCYAIAGPQDGEAEAGAVNSEGDGNASEGAVVKPWTRFAGEKCEPGTDQCEGGAKYCGKYGLCWKNRGDLGAPCGEGCNGEYPSDCECWTNGGFYCTNEGWCDNDPCTKCTPEQACLNNDGNCLDDIMPPLEHKLFEMVEKYKLAKPTVWKAETGLATATLIYEMKNGRWQYDFTIEGQDAFGGTFFPFTSDGKYECALEVTDQGFSCTYVVDGLTKSFSYDIKTDQLCGHKEKGGGGFSSYFHRKE